MYRQESLKYMNGKEPEYNDNTVTSWNEQASYEYDGEHFKSQDVVYQALSSYSQASKSHFILFKQCVLVGNKRGSTHSWY